MDRSWFKTYRVLWSKRIWTESSPQRKVILLTLLKMANYQYNEWTWKGQKHVAEPGQFKASYASIANECGRGVTRHHVETALDFFEECEFLRHEVRHSGTMITIINWGSYQGGGSEPPTPTPTGVRHTSDKGPNYIRSIERKKDRKEKRDRNGNLLPYGEYGKEDSE